MDRGDSTFEVVLVAAGVSGVHNVKPEGEHHEDQRPALEALLKRLQHIPCDDDVVNDRSEPMTSRRSM